MTAPAKTALRRPAIFRVASLLVAVLAAAYACESCRVPSEAEVDQELAVLAAETSDSAFRRRATKLLSRVARAFDHEEGNVASRAMRGVVEAGLASGREASVIRSFLDSDLDAHLLEEGCGHLESMLERSDHARAAVRADPRLLDALSGCEGLAFTNGPIRSYVFPPSDAGTTGPRE